MLLDIIFIYSVDTILIFKTSSKQYLTRIKEKFYKNVLGTHDVFRFNILNIILLSMKHYLKTFFLSAF